jgi:hypothetical protein
MISRLIRQIEFEKNNDDEFKRRLKKIELEIKGSYRPLLAREIKGDCKLICVNEKFILQHPIYRRT